MPVGICRVEQVRYFLTAGEQKNQSDLSLDSTRECQHLLVSF